MKLRILKKIFPKKKTTSSTVEIGRKTGKTVHTPDFSQPLPDLLGVRKEYPLEDLVASLESSLREEFIQNVRTRMLRNNPQMSAEKFDWLFFELKRYFLMAAIMKSAPMFSDEVDEIWHEMLMFTADYQKFCEQFAGQILHHIPNMNPQPGSGERVWFDWVYSHLFEIPETSWKIWGGFFSQSIDPQFLESLKNKSKQELMEQLFHMEIANRKPEFGT